MLCVRIAPGVLAAVAEPGQLRLPVEQLSRGTSVVRIHPAASFALEPLGALASPPRSKRDRPQGPESSTGFLCWGSAFGSVAEMANCTGPETRRTFEMASCAFESRRFLLPVWRNGNRGGLRGRSERVRVRFSPLALCRPGGIGRRAGFRIQSERVRVQVSRPVLPIWRKRQTRRI